ncbi:MAG: ATP-binding protein [Coriobacteriales bacterium]|jgi:predicted AAA+ superfamily ATPase|nr:ATP-binding protein [Coriobacteriales bacterium]
MVIREFYLSKVRPFINKDVVKVLVGMRRSGKSTLLKQIRDELAKRGAPAKNIILMNFESEALAPLRQDRALYHHIRSLASDADGRLYLLFDEIQIVEAWERCVNSLRVDIDCDIYLTGSNAQLLAGELATLLAGRYVSFEVMPFSFREFLLAAPDIAPRDAFDLYRVFGGMPFLPQIGFDPESSLAYLSDVYNSIVLKDIVARHALRDVEQLDRIVRYLFSEAGMTLSVKNIVNLLFNGRIGISRDTIYRYLNACEDALLLTRVKRKDVIGKELLRAAEKVYLTDIGMREALLGTNQTRVNLVFENIVANELRHRGYRIYIGKLGKREVDFVAERHGTTIYVQVAYLLATDEIVRREFAALQDIPDNFAKYVVSADEVDFSQNGIRHQNIRDFLLLDEY